jgi:thiol-disulfide isomerase/thioredoxin
MRRSILLLGMAALVAGCGSSAPKSARPSKAVVEKRLAGAPAPLAKLHDQANALLGGGSEAFKARLASLKGYPVVVNKWASWCGPCRSEFPFLQRQSLELGRKVAFMGVNGNDNDGAAKDFLRQYPVSYPSYKDPNLGISAVFHGVQAFPTTAYYDAKGELAYVHQGSYATEAKLAQDIERYAR